MPTKLTPEQSVTNGIRQYLTITNLLPPTADLTEMAEELTQVAFEQLQECGINLATWTTIHVAEKRASLKGPS